ncbi:MAG: dTMP kinase [Leptospira sp.]|nr:dTMP kinase [Leptospira sp.]
MGNRGKFIVFEGIDGSGKSTLSKNVFEKLSKKYPVELHREPTDYATGVYIRRFLKGEIVLSVTDQLEAFLEDRKLSLEKNILPCLDSGKHVLLDRYFYSTSAYQSDENFSPGEILKMNLDQGFPQPDILFFIEIEPEESLKRVGKRIKEGEGLEVFETLQLQKKIRDAYLKILPSSVIILDGTFAIERNAELCLDKIEEMIISGL